MKKITWWLVILLIFSMSTVFAEGMTKPKVVVLFSDTLTGSQQERLDVQKSFLNSLSKKLTANYTVALDEGFSDQLTATGFNEPILAERGDLVPLFKTQNVDYVILAYASDYVFNINGAGMSSSPDYIFSLRLKIIDVNQNKYLFDGQHYLPPRKSTNIKDHLEKLYIETEKTLTKVMPLLQK